MVEVNDTVTLNSADLSKVVTQPHLISSLYRQLQKIEHGIHRSIGAGRHPSSSGRAGGNDGIDISREVVQGWLNDGKLTLRDEPTTPTEMRLYGSPAAFLEKNGLTDPRNR